MINGFRRWGYRLRFLAPLFLLGVIGTGVVLGLGTLNNWTEWMYPSLIGFMWSLLGLCFVWWFQPPGPNAVLLTTAWGRFKAKLGKLFVVLKCWVFIVMLFGTIGLTVRFVMLWQQGVPL
ncbi:hypothetical protein E4656_02755 [Natronospirillum operosum]|uniref:Uncharacterized protein n=1 Tax=Natronospirillum operosum TaxID=2759953 RepID=A0A4Z0WEA7_9GAMM|nr:hypothetical protein [Natronospirillum operosum]TGG95360.1 hypothetical protein E4656_02755 [Natronospirillum operosum]